MIDKAVVCFIGPDGEYDVTHHGILGKSPVLDCQRWCWQTLPHGQVSIVQFFQDMGVCYYCLLLKIANKSGIRFKIGSNKLTTTTGQAFRLISCIFFWWSLYIYVAHYILSLGTSTKFRVPKCV